MGFEPTLSRCAHGILGAARMPVPPLQPKSADEEIRTLTDQFLRLTPLPFGLRRREMSDYGRRTRTLDSEFKARRDADFTIP